MRKTRRAKIVMYSTHQNVTYELLLDSYKRYYLKYIGPLVKYHPLGEIGLARATAEFSSFSMGTPTVNKSLRTTRLPATVAQLSKPDPSNAPIQPVKWDYIKFMVPLWAIPPLIDGDYTGLTHKEDRLLTTFEKRLIYKYNNLMWEVINYIEVFKHRNDLTTEPGWCVEIHLHYQV